MDRSISTPQQRGLFAPPEAEDSSLFIARFTDGETSVELEAPDALTLARWVSCLGTREGLAEIVSDLAHAYGVHLSDVPAHARSLAEAGLDAGPPPGVFSIVLSRDPHVVLGVETSLSLVGLLRCFEWVLGPMTAAEVLESVAGQL